LFVVFFHLVCLLFRKILENNGEANNSNKKKHDALHQNEQ